MNPPPEKLFEADSLPCVYPPCRECGKSHGMGVKNMITGHIDPLDYYYDCFWKRAFYYKTVDQQIVLREAIIHSALLEWERLQMENLTNE